MTKLTSDKIVKRQTSCVDRLRPVTIELHPWYCRLRVKGTREFFNVPWDSILDLGRKIAAREKIADRLAKQQRKWKGVA